MAGLPTTPDQASNVTTFRPSPKAAARGFREGSIRWFCFLAALVSVATTFGIVTVLLARTVPFFQAVPLIQFLTGKDWHPTSNPPSFGILPLVNGTLMITAGAGLLAVPLGLLSAIFMSEYASPRTRKWMKPALELLAGIPTVVYGYFGLFFVTPFLRHLIPNIQATNAISGAIVVGIMILPLVSSLCEDALAAVPKALREGAYGLGATKMEVITQIVVPAALSGIMASFILALSRALGETMAVTLAAGANPQVRFRPAESVETMTAYIVNTSKGDVSSTGLVFPSLFAVGLTLFLMTMVMNLIAQALVRKFRQVYA